MKRLPFFSRCLALALAVSLLTAPAAWAASAAPQLVLSTQGAATSQTVGLTGLPADTGSLQITLNLSEGGTSYTYVPDSSLNADGLYTTYKQNGSAVTLYLTAKSGTLTQNGALTLGTLTSGTPFTVKGASGFKSLDSASSETLFPTVGDNSSNQGNPSGGSTGGGNNHSDDSGSTSTWSITLSQATGGTLTSSVARAAQGATVTLTAAPESGYVLKTLTVTTAAGKNVSLSSQGNGRYTFTMPAAKVTATAAFAPESTAPTYPFTDVPPGVWYEEAVHYVYDQGLMAGTSEDTFAPELTTSRGMIVTILYRLEGSPAVTSGTTFTDVEQNSWYTAAVAWASSKGIVSGYGEGKFGPTDPITREQMAAILCRYAGYKALDTTKQADLTAFTDAGQVAPYAEAAMGWAVETGLITGTSTTTLSPAGSATRSQAALILMRFSGLFQ
ncbi:MAG TPA: S-layer homology domain-containing protein [Candidatus Flavonifractor merdigallinarum]|uniref:S-layer homology domain-containing protein n=1 Tax=Candidatus Flavonifractor merdigallinarum TaxID=2838589 RepID=A0A9D1Y8D9_9FIRM|nr:S-layer homology domain-containing protein [Candidatus Flavonifractor merdigallinarum]